MTRTRAAMAAWLVVIEWRLHIWSSQRAGISTTSAEALLNRMLNNIDGLCAERDRLKKEQPRPSKGKVLGGRRW
jgi:hypothetical protein